MNAILKEIEDRALQLSAQERGELIEALIASLEGEAQGTPDEVAAAWDAEIARRVADMDAGRTGFVSTEEAMRQLRAHVAQRRKA